MSQSAIDLTGQSVQSRRDDVVPIAQNFSSAVSVNETANELSTAAAINIGATETPKVTACSPRRCSVTAPVELRMHSMWPRSR